MMLMIILIIMIMIMMIIRVQQGLSIDDADDHNDFTGPTMPEHRHCHDLTDFFDRLNLTVQSKQ